MKVIIELFQGPGRRVPTKEGIQKNIDAIKRAVDGKKTAADDVHLIDTLFILKRIQDQLPAA